ncbi:MAG: SDR family oxidoreductase [Chloroflexi bacterium]|nr:SDR family oxidoreductase [Chloroflexota bacterium]
MDRPADASTDAPTDAPGSTQTQVGPATGHGSDGRTAVVTGAGRGLGRRLALALAADGARVGLVSRSATQLEETARLIREAGGEALAWPMDASSPEAVESLRDAVTSRLGAPGVLVNAAGMFGPIALIRDSDPEAWIQTIMVDLVASYLTCRAFVGGMLDAGWGRIVNVTSAASLHPPGPLNSAYATAKVGLNQLTRHLAAEIAGSGVTANVIHPGDLKTDMWADIRDRVSRMGTEADAFRQWAEWVERTGGDPPDKAVALVMRLVNDPDPSAPNGQFLWIEDPLQPPIPSWVEPAASQPWRQR